MLALANAGSDLKITETVRYFERVPSVPHALQGGAAEHIKALCPEAIRPMYGINAGVHHPSVAAPTHIRLKKRRNEARFVLNKKWSSKRYYMQ